MNINDLLNDRRNALLNSDYYTDYDSVEENMGDITGEVDDDFENVEEGKCGKGKKSCVKEAKCGKKKSCEGCDSKGNCTKEGKCGTKESFDGIEFTEYDEDIEDEDLDNVYENADDEVFFDDDDLRDIMIEAMEIEDPEEYIDEALKEFSDETIALVGEMYIDELLTEDAIMFCEDEAELESIEESFKEAAGKKLNSAKESITKIAKKFAAFIQNLIESVIALFSNGEKLVKNYKSTIEAQYKAKGSSIKVKTYKYSHNPGAITGLLNDIGIAMKTIAEEPVKYKDKDTRKTIYANTTGTDGTVEGIKQTAIEAIRTGEKQEYTVSELNLSDILDLAGNKNKHIKVLKDLNKSFQKKCSEYIARMRMTRPVAPTKEMRKEGQSQINTAMAAVKMGSRLYTTAANAYISELRAANRAYTAICRRLVSKAENKKKDEQPGKEKKEKKSRFGKGKKGKGGESEVV